MNKNVTMKNIADAVGVSIVTVSKALADKEGVGNDLRAVIKAKADELGYRYGVSKAKNGRDRLKNNIAVIVANNYIDPSSYSFYLNMYHSVVLTLAQSGYSGIMEIITEDMRKSMIFPKAVADDKVDGVIVLGQLPVDYIEMIHQTGIPMVLLDFYDKDISVDSVVTDNVFGTYSITEYCIQLGHRKIAFVGSIGATSSILDRYLGYYRALLTHNIPVNSEYVIEDRGNDLLNLKQFKLPQDMPTCFVCNNDEVAYQLMHQLRKNGYRVPEDISIAGFDNYTLFDYANTKMTTVAVDVEAMVEEAVNLLVKQITTGEASSKRKVISGTLIIRESIGEINQEAKTESA